MSEHSADIRAILQVHPHATECQEHTKSGQGWCICWKADLYRVLRGPKTVPEVNAGPSQPSRLDGADDAPDEAKEGAQPSSNARPPASGQLIRRDGDGSPIDRLLNHFGIRGDFYAETDTPCRWCDSIDSACKDSRSRGYIKCCPDCDHRPTPAAEGEVQS